MLRASFAGSVVGIFPVVSRERRSKKPGPYDDERKSLEGEIAGRQMPYSSEPGRTGFLISTTGQVEKAEVERKF